MTISKDRLQKNKLDIINIFTKIEKLISQGKREFLLDERNSQSTKYLLIEAVEAIVDTCQHLLAKLKGVPCEGYIDCITKAGREGLIPKTLAKNLRRLADLRNSLIHRYWIIDDKQLYDQTKKNKADFTNFANLIDKYLT